MPRVSGDVEASRRGPGGAGAPAIRVATYNVHGCVGTDGRFDPGRVARVVDGIGAGVIALQELDFAPPAGAGKDGSVPFPADRYAYHVVTRTLARGESGYGHALLSEYPVTASSVEEISYPGREPRKAIWALIETPVGPVQFVTAHLGLRGVERAHQARVLLALLDREPAIPTILAGDLNEWRPFRGIDRLLAGRLRAAGRPRTYPSRLPLFPLDAVWTSADSLRARAFTVRTRLARVASDHLPLAADVRRAAGPVPARPTWQEPAHR